MDQKIGNAVSSREEGSLVREGRSLDRRRLLAGSGALATAAVLSGCATAPPSAPTRPAWSRFDFHEALQTSDAVYLLGSQRAQEASAPFRDPEGVQFILRNVVVVKFDRTTGTVSHRFLSTARLAHTAMRLFGDQLAIFFNEKLRNNSFAMDGRLFGVDSQSLATLSSETVFSNRNWGWSPWIDERGRVHHGDSETRGNPYRIGANAVPGRVWDDLAPITQQWRAQWSPFAEIHGANRATGYLRFLDVYPALLGMRIS